MKGLHCKHILLFSLLKKGKGVSNTFSKFVSLGLKRRWTRGFVLKFLSYLEFPYFLRLSNSFHSFSLILIHIATRLLSCVLVTWQYKAFIIKHDHLFCYSTFCRCLSICLPKAECSVSLLFKPQTHFITNFYLMHCMYLYFLSHIGI